MDSREDMKMNQDTNLRLTSQTRPQPVVIAIQQAVQNASKNGDVVFAVIRKRLSVPCYGPAE